MKLYVGMGLTQAPQKFREDFQQELKDDLREIPDVEILDFVGLEAGTAGDVYTHDRHCTESADLCVFVTDHPSIGLGMEIALRLVAGKPMLVFAHADARITRMLIGMCEKEGVELERYESVADIIERVRKAL